MAGALRRYKPQRRGCVLLNQQCWLWGQDVRRNEGNLLLEFGFDRMRAEDGSSASSQYTLILSENRCLRLWGFGLYYGEQGESGAGVYLNRFEFVTRAATMGGDRWYGAHDAAGLAMVEAPLLVYEAASAIAEYERWVLRVHGVAYRQSCLGSWKKKRIEPALLPAAWQELGDCFMAGGQEYTVGHTGERLLRAGGAGVIEEQLATEALSVVAEC